MKFNSITALDKFIANKITKDAVNIMRVSEALLYNMLNNVITSRVYAAYEPAFYKRTYQLKNAKTNDIGYEKGRNAGTTMIVARAYIDERKMNYKNKATKIPRRIDDDRVRRREDRWTTSEHSSHFLTTAYKEYVDIASKTESELLKLGYIKK